MGFKSSSISRYCERLLKRQWTKGPLVPILTGMRKRFLVGAGIVLTVQLAFEIFARFALPEVPSCAEVSRNAYRFRAWPEYIAGLDGTENTATVVLLTNSQGYAGEFDHRRIYPAQLEELMCASRLGGHRHWEVLNWACDGMTSIELTLLAAYLETRSPDIVLAMTGYADYAAEHSGEKLLYCRSDVPRLATRPALLKRLPASYLRRHVGVEDFLTFLLRDRFALLRYREFVWSWLDPRFPGIHTAFYAPSINYRPWELRGRRILNPLRKSKLTPGDPVLTYREGSRQMLDDYLSLLARIRSRVIVIAQPIAVPPGDPRMAWQEAFMRDLRDLTSQKGLKLWDLSGALPSRDFMTSSHFLPANHERFAAMLHTRLSREFGDAL